MYKRQVVPLASSDRHPQRPVDPGRQAEGLVIARRKKLPPEADLRRVPASKPAERFIRCLLDGGKPILKRRFRVGFFLQYVGRRPQDRVAHEKLHALILRRV